MKTEQTIDAMRSFLAANGITTTVNLGKARYGTRQPEIVVRAPQGTHYRILDGALHRIAAEVELATPDLWHWCVYIDDRGPGVGRICLDMHKDTDLEVNEGMALLRRVAG